MARRTPLVALLLLMLPGLPQVSFAQVLLESPSRQAEANPNHETEQPDPPPLPEGMSLEDVLDYSDNPPPIGFPPPVPDNEVFSFMLFEQLEYAVREEEQDLVSWQAQGWAGLDYDKVWWKTEGSAGFDGTDEGEFDFDLLYSRLVTPFWSVQAGVQYSNEWESSEQSDLWSGVVALQGLAPGTVELDASFYLTEKADLRAEIELEYNLRVTQRLVLQPRIELGFAAQDVPKDLLGAGLTNSSLDLRLRYEFRREISPYVGVRYQFSSDKTARLVEAAGEKSEQLSFVAGIRVAF